MQSTLYYEKMLKHRQYKIKVYMRHCVKRALRPARPRGRVVRALALHARGPGFIPGSGLKQFFVSFSLLDNTFHTT